MVTSDVLLALIVILVAAKLGGALSVRLGLPAVFGQILAGVVLGSGGLRLIHSSDALESAATVGAIILMFAAGLETDVVQMRKVGHVAVAAAFGGVVLPFVAGVGLARLFGLAVLPSLFVGTLLTATSVSISAQTLHELGRLRSREGTAILGAAVVDDVLGLVVLSVVISLGQSGAGIIPLLQMVVFFPLAVIFGLTIVPRLSAWASRHPVEGAGLAMAVVIALFYAWSAESLGHMAAITGAYLAGILVSRTEIASPATDGAKAIGFGLLIPIFFVNVGAQADFRSLTSAPLFVGILIVVAIATKVLGCGLGSFLTGFGTRDAIRVGVGMISRGEVALAVASIGRATNIVGDDVYATAVLVSLVTTLITPILLRAIYAEKQAVSVDEGETEALPSWVRARPRVRGSIWAWERNVTGLSD